MKQYPSIPATIMRNKPYYGFDKLDGSNIRVKWTKKKGYDMFGTRRRLLDRSDKTFGPSIDLFLNKYGEEFERRMVNNKFQRAQAYFEYWSPNSFGGFHADEQHEVTIFDIDIYKKGLMPPKEYLKLTDGMDIAKLLYHGNITEDLLKQIREATLGGMTFEGVIFKSKHPKKGMQPMMFKVKNQAWYQKLREKCDNDKEFERLK